MNAFATNSADEKPRRQERLGPAEALALAKGGDLHDLAARADRARRAWHNGKVFYTINLHIDYTNVCVAGCAFCAYSRRPGEPGGWTHDPGEIVRFVEERAPGGCSELHIVGGLNPALPFEYYTDLLQALRKRFPALHLKAFSAVEIHDMARKARLSIPETLRLLREAGLDSLPGGGAEIFDEAIRAKIAPQKASANEWLAVHRAAHQLGIPSTATMLYGHGEAWEHRIDHMLRLRALQDETGGFQAFIPLSFHPANTALAHLQGPTALDDLRVMAMARLVLDNIPHIKAYWVMLGLKIAQTALAFGADDLHGTVTREAITHMAGGASPQAMATRDLEYLIREAGFEPVLRDSRRRGSRATSETNR